MKKTNILLMLMLGFGLSANAQISYSLEQCLDSALKNNRELQNAAIEMERSREQKSAAYTKYFPEISASVTAFRAFDKMIKGDGTYPQELAAFESVMPGISQLVGQPWSFGELNRGYMASVSIMQPVYAGGQIHTQNQLCELGQDIKALQQQLKEREVVEKVTENYWQIVQLQYNLQTLDAADRQVSAVLEQVEQYVKAGVTTTNDLLKVQLRQQDLLAGRLKVENGIRVLKLLLAQQCGIKDGFDIVRPAVTDVPLAEQNEASYMASTRAEYQLSEKALEAEKLQVRLERGKCLPTVAVGVMGTHVGLGGLSETVRSNMKTHITNGLALATVSVPISEWWTGSHAIRRQKLKVKMAENDRQEALEMLTIDIETAWNNLQEAARQVAVAQTSVSQATENLRQSTLKYKAGTESLTDLLDAETLHRQAQNNLSSAFASYQVALRKYQLNLKSATAKYIPI